MLMTRAKPTSGAGRPSHRSAQEEYSSPTVPFVGRWFVLERYSRIYQKVWPHSKPSGAAAWSELVPAAAEAEAGCFGASLGV